MSQYASAMNTKSGWAAFTRSISGGQYSSAGRRAAPRAREHVVGS